MTMPLLWVSLAFIAGILIASVLHAPLLAWLALAVLVLSCGVVVFLLFPSALVAVAGASPAAQQRRLFLLALASLVALPIGAARYQSSVPPRSSSEISWYNDRDYEMLVTGTLAEPPDVRASYINLRLSAGEIDAGNGPEKVRGLVLARVAPNQEFHYGQNLRLRGQLTTPPSHEDFSYRDYLARQGIRSYMQSAEVTVLPGIGGNPVFRLAYALKEVSLANVYRLFVDPEASLLAGILLGDDSGIPAPLEGAFNDTGTAHIIAISGFNIAVIAGVLAFVFGRLLGPRRGGLAAFIGIWFYAFFVGADAPVVRAAFMGSVALLAVQVGRRQAGMNTLAFVAALMALLNPMVLWDVGFQLSVLATLGLILYGGPFMDAARAFIERHVRSVDARKLISPPAQFIMLTLAAQLTTLPIIAYHFNQLSLVSPLANAVVLPAQPAVMVLGGLALIVSLLIFPLGQLLAWVAWPLAAYTIRAVEFFASVPQGVIYLGSFSLGFAVLFYVVLLAVTFAGKNIKDAFAQLRAKFEHLSLVLIAAGLFVLSLLVWRLAAGAPDGRLHVTFLNVGSADAVFIQSPSGGSVLINGGPSAAAASDALGRRMSPIDHRLDWLILAATAEDQVASLPRLLPRFPPANVLLGAPEGASFSSAALIEEVQARKIPLERAEEGQVLNLGDGAILRVQEVSSQGSTLLLEWRAFRLLLPIGANTDSLTAMQQGAAVGPVNVLLLAQSGYAPLTTPELLQNLHPDLVVISVGAADRDGRPDPQTLELLDGYSVLRTDENGWIEIVTDGNRIWTSSERRSIRPRETPTPVTNGP